MSMADFAKLLGVTHAQVSRYESDQAKPGYRALLQLLNLAQGVEKNPILDLLRKPFGYDKTRPTGSEALRELEEIGRSIVAASGLPSDRDVQPDTPTWDQLTDLWPNLGEVLKLVQTLYSRRREVAPSLAQFLRLWLSNNDTDPSVNQCFDDAVLYLEFLLSKRAHKDVGSRSKAIDPRSTAGSRNSSRATPSVDLDHSKVVDLDPARTKVYEDASFPVEPMRRSKNKSK
jgi:transcriptional regulator with XRE-family HTH domain